MSFVAPSQPSGDYVKVADLDGHLLIIRPTEYKTGITTAMGDAEAIQCDVVDLDTNEVHNDILFFNVALRKALQPNIGASVLGRIGKGVAKPGKTAPWILNDATTNAADVKKATDYLAAEAAGSLQPVAKADAAEAAVADMFGDLNDPKVRALLEQLKKN